MKIIAIANQKGGVGKTAISINLAAALAERGMRTLAIDLDPQGHLTEGLGLDEADGPATLSALILDHESAPGVRDTIMHRSENLDVIVNDPEMFLVEKLLRTEHGREFRLRRGLRPIQDDYDACLIDCPPHLGELLDNALVAAPWSIIPVQLERTSLRALDLLLTQIEVLRRQLEAQHDVMGFVANFVDDTREAQKYRAALEQLPVPILMEVRRRTRIKEAHGQGKTIFEHDPAGDAAQMFRDLASRVVNNLEKQT